jgi:hypothetical protein
MKDIDKQISTYFHGLESLAFPGFGMFKASMPSLAHFPVLLETFGILPKRRYHRIEVFIAELGKVITCVGFLDFLQ